MAVEKLSISLEAELAKLIRSAAAEDGVSVSTWLAEAATARARQRALREALDAFDAEHGPMSEEERRELVAKMRKRSIIVRPRKRAK